MLTILPPALTDLEFNPEVNSGRDGDALVDALLADVAAGLQQRFDLTLEDADVLELDSSTPQKFSRSTAHEAAMSRMCDYRVQLAQEQQNVDIASRCYTRESNVRRSWSALCSGTWWWRRLAPHLPATAMSQPLWHSCWAMTPWLVPMLWQRCET